MSTNPTTPSLEDLRAAAQAPETPPATPAQPTVTEIDGIKYGKNAEGKLFAELPTGAKYLGDNEQQLAINIAKGKVEADRTIQSLKQPPPQELPALAPEIAQAREYLLNETAAALGFSSGQELKQYVGVTGQITQQQMNEQIATGFQNLCPDFPETEQNIDALLGIQEQYGFPQTPQGLRAAHLIAVQEGKYQPLTQDQIQQQRMQALGITPQQVAPKMPAPMLPGSAPVQKDVPFNPYDRSVPLDKIRAWAEQK